MRKLTIALLAPIALAGCGGDTADRTPSLRGLPLAPRAHVEISHRVCDPGANAFCALQLVVVANGYRTSRDLLGAEKSLLKHHGWSPANAPNGLERAADAPGDRLRVTYATASGDLQGVDLGWIRRSRDVTLALSRTMLAHVTALSMLLEVGTA